MSFVSFYLFMDFLILNFNKVISNLFFSFFLNVSSLFYMHYQLATQILRSKILSFICPGVPVEKTVEDQVRASRFWIKIMDRASSKKIWGPIRGPLSMFIFESIISSRSFEYRCTDYLKKLQKCRYLQAEIPVTRSR